MTPPSRRMPQARPAKIGPFKQAFGWAVLLAIASLLACAAWQKPAFGAALALSVVAASLQIRSEKRRLRELAIERPGESICAFARAFDRRQVDAWVIRAVYEEIGGQLAMPGFPLRPGDDLSKTLNLDGDALDFDIAPAIAERTGRSLADTESNPYFDKVRTAADLVLFFNAQPIETRSLRR